MDLASLTAPELLKLHAAVSDELRARGVTRSSNNPVGDLAEHLFCKAFGWTRSPKSEPEADAVGPDGRRYQIKARRITAHNKSRQLGALRKLPGQGFDELAAVLFAPDYTVSRAAVIPHRVVADRASFVEHTNSWRFLLVDAVWALPGVLDVTDRMKAAAEW